MSAEATLEHIRAIVEAEQRVGDRGVRGIQSLKKHAGPGAGAGAGAGAIGLLDLNSLLDDGLDGLAHHPSSSLLGSNARAQQHHHHHHQQQQQQQQQHSAVRNGLGAAMRHAGDALPPSLFLSPPPHPLRPHSSSPLLNGSSQRQSDLSRSGGGGGGARLE
eukprot:3085546-Rhodomonas_salina.1